MVTALGVLVLSLNLYYGTVCAESTAQSLMTVEDRCLSSVMATVRADTLTTCSYICLKQPGCHGVMFEEEKQKCVLGAYGSFLEPCDSAAKTTVFAQHLTCEDGWLYNSVSQTCLLIVDDSMTRLQAADRCRSHGGWLVEIKTKEIQQELMKIIDSMHVEFLSYYIGLIGENGVWRWEASDEVTRFNYWYGSFPSGDGSCVEAAVKHDHLWNDLSCAHTISAVCEKHIQV